MSAHNFINRETSAEISPQLKQLRLERGLSLEQLQAEVHISARLLKRIENGKCLPYSYLRKLCAFYGVKLRIILE